MQAPRNRQIMRLTRLGPLFPLTTEKGLVWATTKRFPIRIASFVEYLIGSDCRRAVAVSAHSAPWSNLRPSRGVHRNVPRRQEKTGPTAAPRKRKRHRHGHRLWNFFTTRHLIPPLAKPLTLAHSHGIRSNQSRPDDPEAQPAPHTPSISSSALAQFLHSPVALKKATTRSHFSLTSRTRARSLRTIT